MPAGTSVDRCYKKLKGQKGEGHAAAICQASTNQSLKTGQKLSELDKFFGAGPCGSALSEKLSYISKHCGGEGGTPGPCPTSKDSNSPPKTPSNNASNWLSLVKKVPAAALAKARGVVKTKYQMLEKRYGRKYAIAIIGAGLAATPIPVPGSGLLAAAPIVAIAELHRRLSSSHAEPGSTEQDKRNVPKSKITQLGVAFIRSLEAKPDLDQVSQFSESASLPNQDIFTTGVHKGTPYTHQDLDQIVQNWKQHSHGNDPKLRVPAVIGHEESQEFLDRSDIPAAGWVSDVRNIKQRCPVCHGEKKVPGDDGPAPCPRCVGTGVASTLKADFEEIPRQVSRLLRRKAYRTVSAEIYHRPPEGISGDGKMLRRVAFLGGEIPQVKSLQDINDLYEHAEDLQPVRPTMLSVIRIHKPQKKSGRRWWTCFSEVKPMSRDEMIAKLRECGYNPELLAKAPDELLAEMIRVEDTKENEVGELDDEGHEGEEELGGEEDLGHEGDLGNGEEGTGPGPLTREGEEDHGPDITSHGPESVSRKDLGAPHQDHDDIPEPADEDERKQMFAKAKSYYERAKKMMEKYAAKMGDDSMAGGDVSGATIHPAETGKGSPTGFDQLPGRHPKKVTMSAAYAELKRGFDRLQVVVKDLQKSIKADVGDLQKFREDQIVSAKKETVDMALDSLVKEGRLPPVLKPHYHSLLMKADTRAVVEKFKEGKTVRQLTEFDQILRDLRRDLPSKFSELFKQPVAAAKQPKEERKEWAKDTFERFSESFRMSNCKEGDFVSMIEKMSEKDFAAEKAKWDQRSSAA